jgi:hypothetical protein
VNTNLSRLATTASLRCAAHEYRVAAAGHCHLLFYNRLMPWNHAAGWPLYHEIDLAGIAEARRRLVRWNVPARRMWDFAIKLHELGVIDIGAKASLHGFEIGAEAIARNLHATRQPLRKITDKFNGRRAAPIADAPRRDQFGVASSIRVLLPLKSLPTASHIC